MDKKHRFTLHVNMDDFIPATHAAKSHTLQMRPSTTFFNDGVHRLCRTKLPPTSPLAKEKKLTLDAIAEWPIVTYQQGFTGRARIDEAFERAEVVPDIVMTALDADVIKAYVELGLGIGIIASMACSAERDPHLRLLDARHLFDANTSRIAVRRNTYLRGYAYRFIELCSSDLTEATVREQVNTGKPDGAH